MSILDHIDHNFEHNAKAVLKKFARGKIVLQAILVGIISGLLAVLFRYSVSQLDSFLFETSDKMSLLYKIISIPLITGFGGLIAGLLVFKIAPESSGSGIPEVKYFLSKLGQKFRKRVIITKFFAGVIGIGAGLSLGREGPSVQLGAGAGALVSRLYKLQGFKERKLIAAGAGAAIGATFNAPIAATIFVLEELVHVFKSSLLFPVLVATVTASVIARSLLGNNYAFDIPKLSIQPDYQNLHIYIVLGIFAGFLGVAFTRNIMSNLKYFESIKTPNWFKPAIAGFFTGLVGVFLPFILGPGNQAISYLLEGKIPLLLIVIVFVGKFFLTPFCFGSGAAGGLFLPTIMLGAFLGYFTGNVAQNFLSLQVEPIVVALVGMGAFLSAVARTPITAVVIVSELTGDYSHILPIMLSAAVADLIADKLNSPSVYALLMLRRGRIIKTKEDEQEILEEALVT